MKMTRKISLFRIGIIFALFISVLTLAGSSGAETKRELTRKRLQNESEMRSARSELERIDAELARLRRASRTTQTRLREAELELKKAIEELNVQQGRVKSVKNEVTALSNKIVVTSEMIQRSREMLAKRARSLLKLSRISRMEFLIKSDDAVEMELRSRLLMNVSGADVVLIDNTVEAKRNLEARKAERDRTLLLLVDEERKLTAAKNNVAARRLALQRTKDELQRQTASTEDTRRKTLSMINRIKTQLAAIQEKLRIISARHSTPTRFTAPTSGPYFRPDGVSLPGVYVKASPGTNVKAIAEGEVVSIQSMHGLGQTLILGHGGNLTSVYANLSSVNVSIGDDVSRGTMIAKSGISPYGNAYYFAVYKNGVAQNPMTFLR